MVNFDDSYYIAKVLKGDTAAYSYLVNRYSDMVYSIALKILVNPSDAEDLSQEVFISAYQSLKDYRGSSKFSTWLYRITFNKAISKLRKTRYEVFTDNEKHFELWGGNRVIQELDNEEEKVKVLEEAIRQLSADEQLLVVLYYFEEQSVEEISVIMRMSVSNVKVKLFRVRKRLKEMIEKVDKKIFLFID